MSKSLFDLVCLERNPVAVAAVQFLHQLFYRCVRICVSVCVCDMYPLHYEDIKQVHAFTYWGLSSPPGNSIIVIINVRIKTRMRVVKACSRYV